MTTEHIAILCAIAGLLAGCAVGYYAGLNVGRAAGWERCKRFEWLRRMAERNARPDPATGRYRKVQR